MKSEWQSKPITYKDFKGKIWFKPEEVLDNGQLFQYTSYMIQYNDTIFTGIGNGIEETLIRLEKDIQEYYETEKI